MCFPNPRIFCAFLWQLELFGNVWVSGMKESGNSSCAPHRNGRVMKQPMRALGFSMTHPMLHRIGEKGAHLCYTLHIPQGLRKFTPVEVASGHDMTVSDTESSPMRFVRPLAQESPVARQGSGQICMAHRDGCRERPNDTQQPADDRNYRLARCQLRQGHWLPER
jgi:hypothetical protein